MARKRRYSATSLVLIPVLVLQTACYDALSAPEPVHPDDNDQMSTLRDADRVDVVLIDGRACRLRSVVVADQRLKGLDGESRVTSFPLDSIQSVQAYVDMTADNIGALVGVVGLMALLLWLASIDWS